MGFLEYHSNPAVLLGINPGRLLYLTGASFGDIWMPIVGWALVALFALAITILIIRKDRQLKSEQAAKQNAKKDTVTV